MQLITTLATISGILVTKNPTATEVQALISQLQEDRDFVILRLEIEKDNILLNSNTLAREGEKCDDSISLLKMIIQMNEMEAVEAKILKKGNEPLFEWLQSMQFKLEMI